MTYFTSDLHFGHSKIMGFHLCFRKFNSVGEMDEALIRHWNSIVTPEDEIYNLGDLIFYKDLDKALSILQRLNGKHTLILGNHDYLIQKHKDELLSLSKFDGNMLFKEICEYKEITAEFGDDKFHLVLFHYPISEWNRGHYGSILLYGHIHASMANIRGKALNVGFDLHGKILNFEEIYKLLKDIKPFTHSAQNIINEDDTIESRREKIKWMLERINAK